MGTGSCTGTGLCEKDFQTNEHGWYTYNGYLVLGTATPYLLNYGYSRVEGKTYFKYYDVITLNINGRSYQGMILDSCGNCMRHEVIDLFVSGASSSITTNITIQ